MNCRCLQSNVICSLKVCPELPVPPPRGCVVIKKPMSCCPYLSCSRKDYHIPKKRLISYLDRFDKESIDRIINLNFHQRRSDDSEDSNDESKFTCSFTFYVYGYRCFTIVYCFKRDGKRHGSKAKV